jgi:hypothetical protein
MKKGEIYKKEKFLRLKYYLTILIFILSFIVCGLLILSCNTGKAEFFDNDTIKINESFPDDDVRLGEVSRKPTALMLNREEAPDIIMSSYRDGAQRNDVLAFFSELIGSADIAEVVLINACAYDIPPALAFALCWEESQYNPLAINHNRNDTVDRGLFQLNSATFPNLGAKDFYNPGVNARYGLSHLRWCLNNAGTEVAGLAMYNAGHNRVRSAGTPKTTLDYVSRILKTQRKIEELFMNEYLHVAGMANVTAENSEKENAGKEKKALLRLSLLTPLGRN